MINTNDNTSTKKHIEMKRGIIEAIALKMRSILIPCDCYLLSRTCLITFNGDIQPSRLYICQECGKSHYSKEESRVQELYVTKMKNLL